MFKKDDKIKRKRRKLSIRKKISGTPEKPRLTVFKSNKYIYVQAIDDSKSITIASASSLEKEFKDSKNKKNKIAAEKVGELIAERLIAKNINTVVFDRNGYLYTGRIKSLADAARKKGLKF